MMGHTDRERRRLALQAAILEPLTENFFVRAGLAPGMRVLDVGCGVGDVAIIAARLAGPRGDVTAIDLDHHSLEIARMRAEEAGLPNISFEESDVAHHHAKRPYDAIVGRHILIHTKDPRAILQQAIEQIHPGGIVAFQEYDLSRYYPNTPPKPIFEKTYQAIIDLFVRATHADIGVQLLAMFRELGLTRVQSRAEFFLDSGPECPYYEWIAETVRSLLPKLEGAGIATALDLDVDTLADRMKQEASALGGYVASPVVVGTCGVRASD
jgi:SAM-dependent methyltransferase